jgi:hypothetical protein
VAETEPAPAQRVSPLLFPGSWELPERPAAGNAQVLDAFRQSEFQLRGDLRLLHDGMNLQLRAVAESYPSRFRTHAAASGLMFWSRQFHYQSGAALLLLRGSYVGVPPLVRSACECQAAAAQSSGDELPEVLAFLSESLHPHEELKATDVGRGSYHAGGRLAQLESLSAVYRASSELARPHFGATMLEVAPESNLQKLAVTFADQAFHFGWAQIELGWLLRLCVITLEWVGERRTLFGTSDETLQTAAAFAGRCETALAAVDRCRIDPITEAGEQRFLISNWRRQPAGAPRRMLL